LVARTLETRWETKLAALAETEQALAAAQHNLFKHASKKRLDGDRP
jgi:hypothetical protein